MRVRHNLYLPPEVSDTLEALASKPGTSKSKIVGDALRAYFAAKGSRELDDMVRPRLDRISRELTAPLPESDAAARAVGRERFEAFVAQVGRQLALPKRSIGHDAGAAS